ncbi:hypothetical protein DIPPA_35803 [Diplonema papillatum]|nr:hypothetical protein DIPPA_25472 [Diplonema papillatum]KAJ9455412.1 hypothetical protein DIPPA_35803 [Diplonema papillatum]
MRVMERGTQTIDAELVARGAKMRTPMSPEEIRGKPVRRRITWLVTMVATVLSLYVSAPLRSTIADLERASDNQKMQLEVRRAAHEQARHAFYAKHFNWFNRLVIPSKLEGRKQNLDDDYRSIQREVRAVGETSRALALYQSAQVALGLLVCLLWGLSVALALY